MGEIGDTGWAEGREMERASIVVDLVLSVELGEYVRGDMSWSSGVSSTFEGLLFEASALRVFCRKDGMCKEWRSG